MPGNAIRSLCAAFFFLATVGILAGETSYTIKEGETLFSVSRRAQVPVDVLISYNGIEDPGKLRAGSLIRIPGLYVVKKGDTLFAIARSVAVPLPKLLAVNGLSERSKIKVGQRLFVPQDRLSTPAARTAENSQDTATHQDNALKPAPQQDAIAQSSPDQSSVWPHPGRREPLRGKITGLVFFGARGDAVRSATGGEVKWVGPYWGWGKTVIIKSPNGDIFLYAGNEQLLVNVGDRVNPGTDIARLGVSPQGGGAKLYFSIQGTNGQFVDPEKYFSGKNHA